MSKVIATQGYPASFHHVAVHKMLGDNVEIISCNTFGEVFELVESGKAEYGVVATENSNHGAIELTQTLLKRHKVTQIDKLVLPIEQCLLVVPSARLSDITKVYSHFVALDQCSVYLDTFLPGAARIKHADTAEAAADVSKWLDTSKAAIASREAGELHGLDILAESIETDRDNCTTFVLFSK